MRKFIYVLIFVLFCSGCISKESHSLIPKHDYAQLFVEKKLDGDVEYKKHWDIKKINKIINLLNSISVETSGDKQTKEIKSKLDKKGTYILKFWTKKDLDNRTIKSTFYMALLQDGHIVYSGSNDHEMKVRFVSMKKKPELVKEIIEMLY